MIGSGENEGQGFGDGTGNSNGQGDTGGWGTGNSVGSTGESSSGTSNNAAGYQNMGDMAGAWGKDQAANANNTGTFDYAVTPVTPEEDKEKPGFWGRAIKGVKDYTSKAMSVPKGLAVASGQLNPFSGVAQIAGGVMAGLMAGLNASQASPEQIAAAEQADYGRATNGPGGEGTGILYSQPDTTLPPDPTLPPETPTPGISIKPKGITSYRGKQYV